jgi:SAM-dependent methyltransferase
MSLQFFEIAEANHRIQNPIPEAKLLLLGDVCDVSADTEVLDLACGKGELLCQWASRHGAVGTGVDVSDVFLSAARTRAADLGVGDRLTFVREDAATYPVTDHDADVVSCLGASWIGDGLLGTLELLARAARDESSLLLVGEPYWTEDPPADAVRALADGDRDRFGTLPELLDRVQAGGFDLVEMVLANGDTWDRYQARQWKTVDEWLRAQPEGTDAAVDAEELRAWRDQRRREYLTYGRTYFGWGAFVLRQNAP